MRLYTLQASGLRNNGTQHTYLYRKVCRTPEEAKRREESFLAKIVGDKPHQFSEPCRIKMTYVTWNQGDVGKVLKEAIQTAISLHESSFNGANYILSLGECCNR